MNRNVATNPGTGLTGFSIRDVDSILEEVRNVANKFNKHLSGSEVEEVDYEGVI